MKTFEEFLIEMQKKDPRDQRHADRPKGRIGGNPRFSGKQGHWKDNSRKELEKDLRDRTSEE
jgi:hypothetical protein